MCKFEHEGKMPIIFDDDSQMFFNTGFIDELASLLRVGGYVPDRYKNVIIPMMIITRLDYVLKDGKKELLDVKIDLEQIEADDVELLQDMIMVSVNDAINQINKETEAKMGKYTQGMPGLF